MVERGWVWGGVIIKRYELLILFPWIESQTINQKKSWWNQRFSDQANIANDANTAYNVFIEKYTGLFDTCFPFKTKGKALNSFRKPWLSKSLLRSINTKNKLHKYLRHRSNEKLKYKTCKNKLTNLLRVAKRLYFQKQIK